MNNKIIYALYQTFVQRGFSVLRFNFRGVGRSQGQFNNGQGELSDAASALDWMQSRNGNTQSCWIAGFSFGAWVSMQLMMRRPEIDGFISIAPPASMHDFSFLAPCPADGIIIHGDKDDVVPQASVDKLVQKLQKQKNIEIEYRIIKGSDHFFQKHMDKLSQEVNDYLNRTLVKAA